MRPPNLSASRIGLLRHCSWWAWNEVQPEFQSDAAEMGTGHHAAVAEWLSGGTEPTEPWFPSLRDWVDATTPFGVPMVEASYAAKIDGSRARLLGVDSGRDYSGIADDEIPGTADAVWIDSDGAVVVDWKFHSSDYADDISGEPGEFGQLLFLAHAVMLATGVETSRIAYVHIWPDHTQPARLVTVHRRDAPAFFAQLQQTIARDSTHPGQHCSSLYCPSLSRCPATLKTVSQLVPAANLTAGIRTVSDVLAWLEAKPLIEKLADQLDREARAYLDAHGGYLELPDGSTYRQIQASRKGFDKRRAAELLGDRAAECESVTEYTMCRRFKKKNG